ELDPDEQSGEYGNAEQPFESLMGVHLDAACAGLRKGARADGGGLRPERERSRTLARNDERPQRAASRGFGGAEGGRTPDLVIANDALSQLSYGPRGGIE